MRDVGVAAACEMWQGGRDSGSSLLRAAARHLTGIPHYFTAPYIDDLDDAAAARPDALSAARALLGAIERRPWQSVAELAREAQWPGEAVAERGLGSKSKFGEDEQITALVTAPRAVISMPLWGFSLDPAIARSYGTRFIFRLNGPLVGVAAWTQSDIKATEAEVIASGVYSVERVIEEHGSTVVELRQTDRIAIA